MNNTKVAMCPICQGRKMILNRTDTRGVPVAYWFACSECDRVTRSVPTLKQVVELAEWVPLAMEVT